MKYRAVLTGASGGIGRVMAAALAPHCASLVLVGRNAQKLDAVPHGPQCTTIAALVHNGIMQVRILSRVRTITMDGGKIGTCNEHLSIL